MSWTCSRAVHVRYSSTGLACMQMQEDFLGGRWRSPERWGWPVRDSWLAQSICCREATCTLQNVKWLGPPETVARKMPWITSSILECITPCVSELLKCWGSRWPKASRVQARSLPARTAMSSPDAAGRIFPQSMEGNESKSRCEYPSHWNRPVGIMWPSCITHSKVCSGVQCFSTAHQHWEYWTR